MSFNKAPRTGCTPNPENHTYYSHNNFALIMPKIENCPLGKE